MKTKLTPLNFVSAGLLVALIYPLVIGNKETFLNITMLLILIVLCFVADILFRTFLRGLKRIWIVEMLFIIFAVVVMLVLGKAGMVA